MIVALGIAAVFLGVSLIMVADWWAPPSTAAKAGFVIVVAGLIIAVTGAL